MDAATITCPTCQTSIPLTAAIEQPIIERLRVQYEAAFVKKDAEIKARQRQLEQQAQELEKSKEAIQQQVERKLLDERQKIITEQQRKAKEAVAVQLGDLQQQVTEQSAKLRDAQQTQLLVLKEKRELEEQRAAFELEKGKQIEAERAKIREEAKNAAVAAASAELKELQEQLAAKGCLVAQAQDAEVRLRKEKAQLDEQKAAFELEKMRQIEAERQRIRDEAKKAALEGAAGEMRELQERLIAKDAKLAEAEQAELRLRKEKSEFEDQKRAFELELARREEATKDAIKKEKDDEFRLKEAEFVKNREDMKRQIDELKRKAEQGSQQAQGEVLELDLEAALARCFTDDEIEPVAKGVHGGDCLQYVKDEMGHACGTIIWESKRTKAWSDGWIDKLKDDKLAAKAQLAVIVSTTMPKDVASFECRANVWVTPPNLAVPLAAALRVSLIETAAAKRAIEGRHDKMEVVYDYLSGPEFKGRVTAIVESFTAMRDDLEAEKKAMQKLWAKREKQLERVVTNTAGLHGDLAGIIGKSLPAIEKLELAELTGNGDDKVLATSAN